MATNLVGHRTVGRDCSMCRNAESVVRVVVTHPLVDSLSTWLCLDCYPLHKRAVDSMMSKDHTLVVTEVAA